MKRFCLLLAALLPLTAFGVQPIVIFTIQDLGTLGGTIAIGNAINANGVVTDAFQVNLTNDNRTQKGRVDSVDGGDEALLAGEPPDPEANPVGDRNRRKQDSGKRHDDDHQNNEEDSILKRHRCETKR
jgi:hypothetical protein